MFKKNKDKEYFKKMIEGRTTQELLGLMQAITEYGMNMAKISNMPGMKKKTEEDIDIQ
jgi:hypothetical protein